MEREGLGEGGDEEGKAKGQKGDGRGRGDSESERERERERFLHKPVLLDKARDAMTDSRHCSGLQSHPLPQRRLDTAMTRETSASLQLR